MTWPNRSRTRCLGSWAGTVPPLMLCATIYLFVVVFVGLDQHTGDYRVYHQITRSVLLGDVSGLDRDPTMAPSSNLWNGHPLYGDESGMDHPLWYRYPPLFLFAFAPFAILPSVVGFLAWTALKCLALAALLTVLARQLRTQAGEARWLQFAAVIGPFLYFDFVGGNVQLLIVALVSVALLWVPAWPTAAAAALGLGIAFKAWPLIFLPYLAALGRWRVAMASVLIAVALTAAPALYFGWSEYRTILSIWLKQETGLAVDHEPHGGSSQSLLGVMSRHLTEVDETSWADPNYPSFNWMDLSPARVFRFWIMLAVASGFAFLFLIRKTHSERSLELHGLAFCALAIFAPYTTLTHLVELLWPALIACANRAGLPSAARPLSFGAAMPTAFLLLNPGRYWVRFGLVFGMYIITPVFLATALLISILHSCPFHPDDLPSPNVESAGGTGPG